MNKDNSVVMLLAAAGVGAITALLLAPCSGSELRRGIRNRADDARNYVNGQADAVQDACVSEVARGKEAIRDFGSQVKDSVDSATEAATSATVDMLDRAKVMVRKAGRTAEQAG